MDKEKRLIRFLLASSLVMLVFLQIQTIRNPPKPKDVAVEDGDAVGEDDGNAENDQGDDQDNDAQDADGDDAVPGPDGQPGNDIQPTGEVANQRLILGSLDPASPYQMAVYFNNRGATIERIELNNPRYQQLDDKSGYLGFLGLEDAPTGGCRVAYVAPGSPAESAKLMPEDRIIQFGPHEIPDAATFHIERAKTRPGQTVELTVMRGAGAAAQSKKISVTLVKRPLSLISPEPFPHSEDQPEDQLSFLWTLGRVGEKKVGIEQDEIKGLPSLRNANWEMRHLPAEGSLGEGVEFSRRITRAELEKVGGKVALEMVKRYRLTPVGRDEDSRKLDPHGAPGYGIQLEMEIRNLGTVPQDVAYQLDGPTGLPLEGWWYSYKVHPRSFSGAGARDVVWENPETGKHEMETGSTIAKKYGEDSEISDRETSLFDIQDPVRLNYIGCDAQYFTVALVPPGPEADVDASMVGGNRFAKAIAFPVGPIDEKKRKRTDVTFRATSPQVTLAGGDAFREVFTIFAGPKQPSVLKRFGLQKCIVYGWFAKVAKPMIAILHFFHNRVGLSWGLSIVVLTVAVRLLMFPIGRMMAMNARTMQELAPEMKKIADKYKDNLEKRSAAQQELFKKHKYNPLVGCFMMPLQMPIFIGLYRGLSVDIELRQAPFFEGMSWCSNLSGPDEFWYWEKVMPAFLGSAEGFLGPYLNLLPFVTVLLFLVQQVLFTPPPQNETQATQQSVMKFMMLFMGIMFHKIAAGLCVYMITSSLWGIGERLLLPKPKAAPAGGAASTGTSPPSRPGNDSNGAAASAKRKKRRKQRKK